MKKISIMVMLLCMFVSFPFSASADVAALIKQADALFKYYNGNLKDYQASIDLYKKALEQDPKNFEATWKCARSFRFYGNLAQQKAVKDWKKICATYGKEGMQYAQKAIDMKPDKPHGYFYYGLSVGIYADGVSILTALKEGLKDKTQKSFEKVIKIDKHYEKAGAILGLGRFWSVLPWPLKKTKKALEYYRQYQATEFFGIDPEGPLYLSELLIDIGGKKNKAEAKAILTQFKTDNPFFKKWAEKLLKKV